MRHLIVPWEGKALLMHFFYFQRSPAALVSLNAARSLSFAGGKVPANTAMWLDGQYVQSKPERWIDVHNPATNEVVTKVPQCTQLEMEQAVESAKGAFKSWSTTSPLTRQQIMFR